MGLIGARRDPPHRDPLADLPAPLTGPARTKKVTKVPNDSIGALGPILTLAWVTTQRARPLRYNPDLLR